jgi:benzoate-CoA ligase
VVGYKDKDELIKPYAFVVLNPDEPASDHLQEEIKQFVRERIATYKFPRWIEFADSIPKTSGGKIQRFVLQEKIQSK